MNAELKFDHFIGNPRVVDILGRAVRQNRLPHGLIFAGREGVGKATLAVLLAQWINCPTPGERAGCGTCSTCRRIASVLLSRGLQCASRAGSSRCGACPNCRTIAGQHPDVRFISPDEKTTISINQVRSMIEEISFKPFEARYRVTILDPADQMRLEAMNSLLKTLEEPPSQTIIILITPSPFQLPVTVRSRSRLVPFAAIPQEQIERYLVQVAGHRPEEARIAAVFSDGSLGAALSFNSDEFREARAQAVRFVSLMLERGSFAEVSRLAAGLAKEKDRFPLWLRAVEALLQDVYYASTAPDRISQPDIASEIVRLARAAPRRTVVSALGGLKRLRAGLLRNVNRQLAVETLFLSELGEGESGKSKSY
jgi:DNA polymerase III subunit delta'